MTARHVRGSASVRGLALLGAACWAIQPFLPWTLVGPLSHASPIDVATLMRSGVLVTLPPHVAELVLAAPVLGLVLALLSFHPRRWVALAQLGGGLLIALGMVALAVFLGRESGPGLGMGVWVTGLGATAFVGAAITSLRNPPSEVSALEGGAA